MRFNLSWAEERLPNERLLSHFINSPWWQCINTCYCLGTEMNELLRSWLVIKLLSIPKIYTKILKENKNHSMSQNSKRIYNNYFQSRQTNKQTQNKQKINIYRWKVVWLYRCLGKYNSFTNSTENYPMFRFEG